MSGPRRASAPPRTSRFVVAAPYLWLIVFFLVPFLIVFRIALSEPVTAQPPYLPVLDLSGGLAALQDFLAGLTFDSYRRLLTDGLYLGSLLRSLGIAVCATALLLLIGFPVAYAMARAPRRWQPILFMLIVLPFWTSFLIRVYAWMTILQTEGLLNKALLLLGLIERPIVWLPSDAAVMIGLVYTYLPFMVLPIYAALERFDETLLEAAADLGATRLRAFWAVTVPLAMPGVIAGALLCFIPITGEFVIPDLLGGSDTLMIGQTIWMEFFNNRDWPMASAVAVVLLCALVVPLTIYQRMQARRLDAGG